MVPGSRPRSITIWLALAGYVLVASGIPLPLGERATQQGTAVARRLAGKDRSRPFPCMNKPCGCATARQCFTKCCCNTPAETLRWARAHGVEPDVLAALERRAGMASTVNVAAAAGDRGCCIVATKPRESCCATDRETLAQDREPARAEDEVAQRSELAHGGEVATEGEGTAGLSLRAMLACGGIVAEWLVVGAALPPPVVELAERLVVVERRGAVDGEATGSRAAPEAPPPRRA